VIIDVFVAQHQSVDSLGKHLCNGVVKLLLKCGADVNTTSRTGDCVKKDRKVCAV
jgi:hypothetical protein